MSEVDPPAYRRMSPALVGVDSRLHAWSIWCRRNRENIGWPTTSPAWRMMEQHRIGVRIEPQHIPVHIPDDIAEIDAIVSKLPPKFQRIVHAQYFVGGPIEAKAKAARLSVPRFRQLLESMRWAVYISLEVNFCPKYTGTMPMVTA